MNKGDYRVLKQVVGLFWMQGPVWQVRSQTHEAGPAQMSDYFFGFKRNIFHHILVSLE